MRYLLFDIGGTAIKYAVGDEDGNLTNLGAFDTPGEDINILLDLMCKVRAQVETEGKINGVAISSPGGVDRSTGIVTSLSAVPCLYKAPLGQLAAVRFEGLPVSMENDSRCFALGELWKGAAVGKKHFSSITIGSGIGGAMVFDGQVLHGSHIFSGEVSNLPFMERGSIWSQWSDYTPVNLAKNYGEILNRSLTGKELFELADSGDERAAEYVEQFYYYTALGCIIIQLVFDPECIVVGGGISKREGLLDRLNEEIEKLLKEGRGIGFIKPNLILSVEGNCSNLRGALYCLLQGKTEDSHGYISI